MVDEPALLERGVLTTPAEVWDLAVRRAEVIGQLATGATVGHVAADAAAVELGVSRRQVYAMLARWRAGSGLASDPVPGRSSGGRGRELLRGLADLGAEVHDDEARTFGDGFGDLHGHLTIQGSSVQDQGGRPQIGSPSGRMIA